MNGYCIRHVDGRWRTLDSIGMPDWTDKESDALCFRRREHADACAADDPDEDRIVEASEPLQIKELSDTPITDAAEVKMLRLDGDVDAVVHSEVARRLERRLSGVAVQVESASFHGLTRLVAAVTKIAPPALATAIFANASVPTKEEFKA